jgi:hypothetical protein
MRVKLTRWTGATTEIETASVPLAVVLEYPEFAKDDETDQGWVIWVEANDVEVERYAPARKAEIYNATGDLCATFEQIDE